MLVNRKALLLSTILQAGTIAWADTTAPQNSRKIEPPKTAITPSSKFNYFDLRLPSEHEMATQQSPVAGNQTFSTRSGQNSLNLAPSNSLHLTQGEHHPVLEYRLSDKNSIRFHINAHSAGASTSWGF